MRNRLYLGSVLLAGAFACDGKGDQLHPTGPITNEAALQAMKDIPNGLMLHETVIHRSCSPNGGVCHNGKEYPDLHTFGNLVQALDRPCNRDKGDEPESVFDGCEPTADELVISGGAEWRSRIAYVGPEEYPPDFSTVFRRVMLENPVPQALDHAESKIMREGRIYVDMKGEIYDRNGNMRTGFLVTEQGKREALFTDLFNLDYRRYLDLGNARGGDPNGNGVFGAEHDQWKLMAPGYPSQSYLVGRITGTVPGSRMPLANQRLTDPEYIAIYCWIETLDDDPQPTDPIDYENCSFAHDPVSYQF